MRKIKVLFIAANPEQTTKLKLDEEIRAITQKIRASDYRDSLDLISVWAARPDDLIQYLNEHKPQMVHFSGHGNKSGDIVLVDNNGEPKPISPEAIKSLFRTLKDNIQLVVLNACYTKHLAEAITDTIGCAVGMNTSIGDSAAIVFAASFYRAIGFGCSVQEAFDQGKTALLLEGIQEDQTPELLAQKYINPSKLYLLTLPPDDAGLLQQHRVAFDRPAFRMPCIHELFLEEVIEAVDDTQGALNTGSLFSRSGKLLTTFPSKNDYQSNEFKESFRFITDELSRLKRLVVSFQETFNRIQPSYSHHKNFVAMMASVLREANPQTIRNLVSQMDEIDESRNEILQRLNQLLRKYGQTTFPLIEVSSEIIKKEQIWALIAKYL